jgi:hypothetical protein
VSSVRNLWILLIVVAMGSASCRKDAPPQESPATEPAATEAPATEPPAAEAPAAEAPATEAPGTPAPAQPVPATEGEGAPTPQPAPGAGTSATEPVAADPGRPAAASPEAAPPEPATTSTPAPAPAPQADRARPAGAPAAPPLPDLRLLLTTTDIEALSAGKGSLRRTSLAGVPPSAHADGLLYEPAKGTAYGVGIQVFREDNSALARDRFNGMLASYPSAQEIAAVAGRTFFAYWDDVMFLGFIQPARNLVIVLSCGRTYCTSDGLYELARKVSARSGS